MKIDWEETIFMFVTISSVVLFFLEFSNLISCWETSQHGVHICNYTFRYYLFYLFAMIWVGWTSWNMISLICFKWE